MTAADQAGMTPLVVAGAVSLAKYVVDRIDARINDPAASTAPASKADFRSALNRAHASGSPRATGPIGLGMPEKGSAGRVAELAEQILKSSDVQAGLRGVPASGLVELEVRSDGSLLLHTTQGVREISVSDETRSLSKHYFTQSLAQSSAGLAIGGLKRGSLGDGAGVFLPVPKP